MKNKENRHLPLLTAVLLAVLLIASVVSSSCGTSSGYNGTVSTTDPSFSPDSTDEYSSESPSDTGGVPSGTAPSPVSTPIPTSASTSVTDPTDTHPVTTVTPDTTSTPLTTEPHGTTAPVTTSSPVTTADPVITSAPATSAAQITTSVPPNTSAPGETSSPVTEPDTPETTSHVHVFSDWQIRTAPTCTESGTQIRTCSCGEEQTQTVAPLGHKIVNDPAVSATPRTPGLSVGSHCCICDTVITEQKTVYFTNYSDPSLYASHYYYDYIGTLPNGEALQNLYNIFEADCLAFHTSGEDAEGEDGEYIVSAPNVTELGLTIDEAYSVWSVFRYDHPLYYWIKASVGGLKTTIGSQIIYNVRLYCTEEYASGSARTAVNQKIYAGIAKFMESMNPESSDYMMAFQIHDAIAHKIDYAYSAPDVPEDAPWAHSVEGFFLRDAGVCECYAKTFLMFMTLNDIECILVTNDVHSWNMLRADDGKWYWVDATWDDVPNWSEGVCHLYFCVNDTEMLWRGYYNAELHSDTFFTDPMHTLNLQASVGDGFSISLPARSSVPYSSADHPVKVENFSVGHNDYYISGYDSVSLKKYYASDVFPDTLEYRGYTYRIIKP